MGTEQSSKPGVEARRMPRKSLRTLGQIISPRSNVPIDCTVVDLSATGARIMLGVSGQRKAFIPTLDIPQLFSLQMPRDNIAVECRLAWQTDNMIGAQFLSTFRPIKAPKPKVAAELGLRKPDGSLRKPDASPSKPDIAPRKPESGLRKLASVGLRKAR